ncbi:MAG: hypothetical protein ACI4XL_08735 [Bacillus sp. (in: firmicutes)]
MRIVLQSMVISFVVHIIYLVGAVGIGYVQTLNYKPDIGGEWENLHILSSHTAFGYTGFPYVLLFTFFGVALVSWFSLLLGKKVIGRKNRKI